MEATIQSKVAGFNQYNQYFTVTYWNEEYENVKDSKVIATFTDKSDATILSKALNRNYRKATNGAGKIKFQVEAIYKDATKA
jgi:hypothetical protein